MTKRFGVVMLAACAVAAAGWLMVGQGNAGLEQTARAQVAGDDAKGRLDAMKKLAADKDPATAVAMEAGLADKDPLVRRMAIYALQRLANPAEAAKIAPLMKDSDFWVRRTAATALGRLGSKDGVPALLEALKDDNLFVRIDSFTALGRIGDPATQLPILKAAIDPRLWSETDIWDQVAILDVLGREFFTDPAGRDFLISMLKYADLPHPELAKLQEEARKQHTLLISQWSAYLLVEKYNDPAGEEFLLKGLQNVDDDYMFQSSAKALAKLKSKKAIPLLTDNIWFRNEFINNRRYMAEALGEIRDPSALPTLEKMLKDPDFRLRSTAAAAMEKIDGQKRAVEPDGPAAKIPEMPKELPTPGGKRPPQFIVLGVDDCANTNGVEAMLDICETLKEKGSKAVFTMWLAPNAGDWENSDMEKKKFMYQRLFDLGCEVAMHTLHHNPEGFAWESLPKERQIEEIEGCTKWDQANIEGFTRPFTFKGPGGGNGTPLDRAYSRELLNNQNFIYRAGRGGHPAVQKWPLKGQLPMTIAIGSLDSSAGWGGVHALITDPIVSDYPGRFDFDLPEGVAMWKANFDYHYNLPTRPIIAVNAFHDWGLKALSDPQGKGSHRNEAKMIKAFLIDVLVTNKDKYPDTYCVTYRQVMEYANTDGDLKQTLGIGNGQDKRNPVKPSVE